MNPGRERLVASSFLTSGPRFQLSVPDVLDPIPELVAPIDISGGVGREFVFHPAWLKVTDPPHILRLPDVVGAEARIVEIRKHRTDPVQWFLRWLLASGGSLNTHVREEDGFDQVQFVADHIRIREEPGSAPFVFPDPPLKRMVSRRPGYLDRIKFFDPANLFTTLQLSRPVRLSTGSEEITPFSDGIMLRRSTRVGVEIVLSGRFEDAEARGILTAVESTLQSG